MSEERSSECPAEGEREGTDDDLERELAARFWNRVRLLASYALRDSAAAEDVAQETMRRVVDALRMQRVHNRDALAAFVLQTARNICLHYSRSDRRKRLALSRLASGYAGSPPAENPLHDLLTRERLDMLKRAIDGLEASDRQLLWLFYGEGLDAAGVAERLQIAAGAARVRKHRALQEVLKIVQSFGNTSSVEGTTRDSRSDDGL